MSNIKPEVIEVETNEVSNNELAVIGLVHGQITTNFDKFKQFLMTELEEYRSMEVTQSNLAQRKKDRQKLTASKKAIDNRRKEVKKEFLVPLDAYEAQCKEAVAIIAEVESELKAQTDAFDAQVKEENRKYYSDMYFVLIDSLQVPKDYKDRVVPPNMLNNLTCKKKDLLDYLNEHAGIITTAYQKVVDNKLFVENTVVSVSELTGLASPITVEDVEPHISSYEDMNPNEISNVITNIAKKRKLAEEEAVRRAEEKRRREEENRKREEEERLQREAQARERQEREAQLQREEEEYLAKQQIQPEPEPVVEDKGGFTPVKQVGFEPIKKKTTVYAVLIDSSEPTAYDLRILLDADGYDVKNISEYKGEL